jgi:Fe-S oxidoreductase
MTDKEAIRYVSKKLVDLTFAGRGIDKVKEDIRREGMFLTPGLLRNSIIGGLEIKRIWGNGENMVIIGCACYGTAIPLLNFFHLLVHLNIDYSILNKEYCCGAPLIYKQLWDGEAREEADKAAEEFTGLNIKLAKEQGCKRVVYFCLWCAYLAKRFNKDTSMEILFYPDFLKSYLANVNLSYHDRVGYFGGIPHRKQVLLPKENWEFDWEIYRGLLKDIKGLEVVDIPRKHCCQIEDEAIWKVMEEEELKILVTPCITGYGGLSRRAPKEIKVLFLTDLFLNALTPEK